MRERIVFGIMVSIMLFLFAFVFLVLGKGEYEPPPNSEARVVPTEMVASIEPA